MSGRSPAAHRMMLEHYTQAKCLLVSSDDQPLGFFQQEREGAVGR